MVVLTSRRWTAVAAVGLLLAPLAAAAQESSGPVAAVSVAGAGVSFQPVVSGYESLKLTVTGPGGFVHEQEFDSGAHPSFSLFDAGGAFVADGVYTWELRAAPRVAGAARRALQTARASGEALDARELSRLGLPPAESLVQSGHFRVSDGSIVTGGAREEPAPSMTAEPTLSRGLVTEGDPEPKQTISGDLTVYNSLCVGFDCATNETYGFDTIRLKENNTRLQFDDTSTASGFPTNNWQIRANSSASGGAGFLAFVDQGATGTSESGDILFSVAAGAPNNSLFVRNNGNVGFGTSVPVVELHSTNGDTPTLRLDQNTSSGFASQVWDVAGNETSFFVRDATNGSTLPFRIFPGAASSSLIISGSDDIGVGTNSPGAAVHVRRTSGEANFRLETTASAANRFELINAGGKWEFVHGPGGAFIVNRAGVSGNPLVLSPNGDLTIQGSLIAQGGAATFPDYVFEPDYELMPLSELADYVRREKHLPGVPSREDVREAGGVNVTRLQLQLLEKVEELTLHILEQQEQIHRLQSRLEEMEQLRQAAPQ